MVIDRAENIYTSLTTPDGTALVSKHIHDFVSHKDSDSKTYFIDGGNQYTRASCHGDEVFFTVDTGDPHKVVREYLTWGTYGKTGKDKLKYVLLEDMSTNNIIAVLENVFREDSHPYRKAFEDELKLRRKVF